MTDRYLADTSALARLIHKPGAMKGWKKRIDAGLVSVCPPVELEMMFTARSVANRDKLARVLRETFP